MKSNLCGIVQNIKNIALPVDNFCAELQNGSAQWLKFCEKTGWKSIILAVFGQSKCWKIILYVLG